MKILKPLRSTLIFGNFLLLFRNVSYNSKKLKIIMYLIAIAEVVLIICNGTVVGYYYLFHHFSDIIYIYMAFVGSILFIHLSLYHSKSFHLLLTFLDANSDYLMKDPQYLKEHTRRNKIFIASLIIFYILKTTFIAMNSRYNQLPANTVPYVVKIVLEFNILNTDIRFAYEYCLLYTLLYLISEQLECMIRYIVKENTFVALVFESTEADITSDAIPRKHIDDIETWTLTYTYLSEATTLFNKIFGVQITIMLITTVSYICIFLYSMAFLSVHGYYEKSTVMKYCARIIIYHIQIFLLSRAAQRIQNNVDTLRRRLSRLLINSLTDNNWYRATKDLLRLVSYHEMKIRAFGSITVDMSLPPTCIILFTSYTVIALQFNNVI